MNEFETALDRDPANWPLRAVYADWLEERGDTKLATAQRWMAENRKRPNFEAREEHALPNYWGWLPAVSSYLKGEPNIEMKIAVMLRHTSSAVDDEKTDGPTVWMYPTRIAAEAALADALERLEVTA